MAAQGRVALVTGASTGIGRESALALVAQGFTVVGTSRRASTAPNVAGVTFLDLDVTSAESVDATVASLLAAHGRLDVLVNNAGLGSSGAAEETSIEHVQTLFDTNVLGVMRVTNAVLPTMRAQKSGRIVNISSIVGLIPQPYMAAYSATKHAIEGYSESLDHELREFGIRVALVEPAWTRTSFASSILRSQQPLLAYSAQRQVFEEYMAGAVRDGDDPAVVAKAVVAAATDTTPGLRYAGSRRTATVSALRRFVPARMFDKQVRTLNKLPA
ncbi:oxidoreductase [Rathayibacter sp. VKM Ac-2857]|uniref:oxidoreductase n=1 Tax=Rathayibacter sp. VKM Ac-2857 TaxID=2739020 RepID=UPI00156601A1|nr:oxidoreductase [Rathayibacter sp. VKM Ac-2857]NQX18309.1 SDR family NAD(P)-dependent oxidoreductase [Rathayibacter sp. VKM Ac-2857]